MIKRKEQMAHTEKSNMRGGNGTIHGVTVFEQSEVPKTRVYSVMTFRPGDSIGVHSHTGEGETYLILEGDAVVTEDGVDYVLHAGDAEYCSDGHTHAIANQSDRPMSMLAIVML